MIDKSKIIDESSRELQFLDRDLMPNDWVTLSGLVVKNEGGKVTIMINDVRTSGPFFGSNSGCDHWETVEVNLK